MIQSDKFDSLIMEFKKLANNIINFTLNRIIEIVGVLILLTGIFSIIFLSETI